MKEFDVAISFAGEDRSVAREIALSLKRQGLRVFYDDEEQANLLGECLTEYLVEIYKNRSSYCVVLVSQHYVRKRWTRHEWKAAQARAFEEFDNAYILPIRLDDAELPGLLPTIGFLSLKAQPLKEIIGIIYEKVVRQAELNQVARQADSAFQQGKYDLCVKLLENPRLKGKMATQPQALKLLANAKIALRLYQDAISALKEVLRLNKEDFEGNFLLGICYYRVGEFGKAVSCYEHALRLSPNHITVITDLKAARVWRRLSQIPLLGQIVKQLVTRVIA